MSRQSKQCKMLRPQWDAGEGFRVALVRKAPMARSVDDPANAFLFAFARDLWRDQPPIR